MSDQKQPTEEQQTYLSATSEIDTILAEIESASELDIDALAGRVERAAELISFCNERLKSAETRVRKVARDLSASAAEDVTPEQADRAPDSSSVDSSSVDSSSVDQGKLGQDDDDDDDVPF